MDKLQLTEDLVELPVTDIKHVINEINLDRKAKDKIVRYKDYLVQKQRKNK